MKTRQISLSEVSNILGVHYLGQNHIITALHYADVEIHAESVLSFCNSSTYLRDILESRTIRAVFCTPAIYEKLSYTQRERLACFVSDDPSAKFYYLHNHLYDNTLFYSEWNFKPRIGKNCRVAESAFLDHGVVLGDHVTIGANTSVLRGTRIGNYVKIDANTVIGAEGNATKYCVNGKLVHIHHAGGVEIGDHSYIGSQTLISRNVLYGRLQIGSRCQIDNCVHIGHNAVIGDRCVVSAGSVICGSVVIEEDCYFAPGTVVRDKVHIGRGVVSHLGAVIVQNVDSGSTVAGVYAMPHSAWLMKTKDDREKYLR